MKKIGQKFRDSVADVGVAKIIQVAICLLLAVSLLSNIHLHSEVETLRTQVDEYAGACAEMKQGVDDAADTIGILEQAAITNVTNVDEFLSYLETNRDNAEKGFSHVAYSTEEVEPTRVFSRLLRSNTEFDYELWLADVFGTKNGGATTYSREVPQKGEYGYTFSELADEFRVTVDLHQFMLNAYGIFEGDVYVEYDDGLYLGNIRIFVHNKVDDSVHRVDIPFETDADSLGLKSGCMYHGNPVSLYSDGELELVFSHANGDEAPEPYAKRFVGETMIGNVMVISGTDYQELPA